MKTNILAILFALLVLPLSLPAQASGGGEEEAPQLHWSFDGVFGTYDKASMQRGLKVYREICAGCHGLKRVYFRNLEALGYDEGQIKTIAAEYTVADGPNEEGDMFERPALPSDAFPEPFPNDQIAKLSNMGALPPDMSLITKARADGPNYVAALLTGYDEPPHDAHLSDGQYWNKYMPGHVIAMSQPLYDGMVTYEDGAPETADQYSIDVVHFLTWAADPYMEDRKRTGIKTLIFLFIFTGVMYGVKRKIWAKVH